MLSELETSSALSPKHGGTHTAGLAGLFGDHLATDLLPRYSELSRRGHLFNLSTPQAGVTIAATHVSPLAAGTGTPILSIWNPINSNTLVLITRVVMQSRSGTPGGPLVWNYLKKPAITATPSKAMNVRTLSPTSVCDCFVNAALTGGAAFTFLRMAMAAAAVATASFQGSPINEEAGALPIFPDMMLALAATAAGTTHIVDGFIEFTEVPLGLVA